MRQSNNSFIAAAADGLLDGEGEEEHVADDEHDDDDDDDDLDDLDDVEKEKEEEEEEERNERRSRSSYGGLRSSSLSLSRIGTVDKHDFVLPGAKRFRNYCPDAFRELRELEGIDDKDYMEQILTVDNKAGKLSEGASGAFMFFTKEGGYIIKSIRREEAKVLHDRVSAFISHFRRHRKYVHFFRRCHTPTVASLFSLSPSVSRFFAQD